MLWWSSTVVWWLQDHKSKDFIPLAWTAYGSAATHADSVVLVLWALPLELPCKRSSLWEAVVCNFDPFPDDIGGSSAFRSFSHCSDCLQRACSFAILSWISDVWMSCCFAVAAFCSVLNTCCVLCDMQLNKSLHELTKVPCCWIYAATTTEWRMGNFGPGMIRCHEVSQSVNC